MYMYSNIRNLNKTQTFVDVETGEIKSGIFITTEEQELLSRRTKTYKAITAAREELNFYHKLNGGKFTFSIAGSVEELFENQLFSDAEKVHIMFLGSYVNHQGYLMTRNNLPITKKWLMDNLKIKNKKRFYTFYNNLEEQEFIVESQNKLYWMKKLSFKGSPKEYGTKSSDVIKTYDETIQRLYQSNEPKSLSIIFRLIPYLNKYHNVLCNQIEEKEYDNCYPLEINELAELLGEKDCKYLKKKMLRIRLKDEYIFSFRQTGTITTILVNPSLIWLSTYPPSLNLVGDFSLAKAKLLESRKMNKK